MGWFGKKGCSTIPGRRPGLMSGQDLLRAAMLEWRRQEGLVAMFDDCRARDRSWPLLLELYIALVCGGGIPVEMMAGDGARGGTPDELAVRRLVRAGLAMYDENERAEREIILTQDGRRRVEAYLSGYCRPSGEFDEAARHEKAMRVFQARFRFEPERERDMPMRRRG